MTTFRMLNNGRPCCVEFDNIGRSIAPRYACEACKKHFTAAARFKTTFKTTEEIDTMKTPKNCDPPDPYAAAIRKLQREEAARTKTSSMPRRKEPPLYNGVPDGYADALRRMREENQ